MKNDLSIAEKAYIEEHSTKEKWSDIFTLQAETGIDYNAIIAYRKQLIGSAKANKMLDRDFLGIVKKAEIVQKENNITSTKYEPISQAEINSDPILQKLDGLWKINDLLKHNNKLLEENNEKMRAINKDLGDMVESDIQSDFQLLKELKMT